MTCKELKHLNKLVKRLGKLANDPEATSDDVCDAAQIATEAFAFLTTGALLVTWTTREGFMHDSDHYEAFRIADYTSFADAVKAAEKVYRRAVRKGRVLTASISLTLDSTDY